MHDGAPLDGSRVPPLGPEGVPKDAAGDAQEIRTWTPFASETLRLLNTAREDLLGDVFGARDDLAAHEPIHVLEVLLDERSAGLFVALTPPIEQLFVCGQGEDGNSSSPTRSEFETTLL